MCFSNMVELLASAGADLDIADKDGDTALHYPVVKLDLVIKEQQKDKVGLSLLA